MSIFREQHVSCFVVRHTFIDVVDLPSEGPPQRARSKSCSGLHEKLELERVRRADSDSALYDGSLSDADTMSPEGELTPDGAHTPERAFSKEDDPLGCSGESGNAHSFAAAVEMASPGSRGNTSPWLLMHGITATAPTAGYGAPASSSLAVEPEVLQRHMHPKQTCADVATSGGKAVLRHTSVIQDTRTTVMLRNLPNNYKRATLLRMLDEEGFHGLYDFLYLPMDLSSRCCLGYAFVNLLGGHAVVVRFWRRPCSRGFTLLQVPDDFKPVLFQSGIRVSFPPPTKSPKAPRLLNRRPKGGKRRPLPFQR